MGGVKRVGPAFVLTLCALLFLWQNAWAWQHIHHIQAAKMSFQQLPGKCRSAFDLSSLLYGGVESDKLRSKKKLINPSHKKDTWRITKSYEAALKVKGRDRYLASRRIARSFHYILDQSEAEDHQRERLRSRMGIDSRAMGLQMLMQIQSGANNYYRRNYAGLVMRYAKYKWPEIEAEVRQIRRNMNSAVEKSLQDLKSGAPRQQVINYYAGAMSYYLTSILALQKTLMHRFCAYKPGEGGQADRAKLYHCLCSCYCLGKNMDCAYHPQPINASPACRDVKNGPCVAQGFGCARFKMPPDRWCHSKACQDCMSRCRTKHGG